MNDNVRLAQEFKKSIAHVDGGYVLIKGGAAFCWVSELGNYIPTHDDIGSLIAVGDDGTEYGVTKGELSELAMWYMTKGYVEVPRSSLVSRLREHVLPGSYDKREVSYTALLTEEAADEIERLQNIEVNISQLSKSLMCQSDKGGSQSEILTFYKVLDRITKYAESKGFSCTVKATQHQIIKGIVFEFSNGDDRLTTMITRDFIEGAELNAYDFLISEIDRRLDPL